MALFIYCYVLNVNLVFLQKKPVWFAYFLVFYEVIIASETDYKKAQIYHLRKPVIRGLVVIFVIKKKIKVGLHCKNTRSCHHVKTLKSAQHIASARIRWLWKSEAHLLCGFSHPLWISHYHRNLADTTCGFQSLACWFCDSV